MRPLPIQTDRLLIRRLRAEDAKTLASYRSIPIVAEFQAWTQYSIEQAQELIALMDQSSPAVTGDWFQFGIELAVTGELIGDIGFLNTDGAGKSWIGFTLDPRYWKRGFASEAVAAVLEYYSNLGVSTVWASTDPANIASRNLLERLGFFHIEDTPEDSVYRKSGPDDSGK